MKRVMCLYRVSTKGQVDPQDDIPMQRRECLDFISRQPEWKFTGELMEKGVSGYKISASKRDAIQEIRSKAERREFDILLVFMTAGGGNLISSCLKKQEASSAVRSRDHVFCGTGVRLPYSPPENLADQSLQGFFFAIFQKP